jgi:hypothetical protein
MSWWDVPDTADDVTGDGPVDAVDEVLTSLQQKPSLAELMRALELAIKAKRDRIADVPATVAIGLKSGEPAANDAPPELVDALQRAVEGIADSFDHHLERKPRVVEVVYTFTFSLGGEPEGVLRPPYPEHIVLTIR